MGGYVIELRKENEHDNERIYNAHNRYRLRSRIDLDERCRRRSIVGGAGRDDSHSPPQRERVG